jgi:hypothetical protein
MSDPLVEDDEGLVHRVAIRFDRDSYLSLCRREIKIPVTPSRGPVTCLLCLGASNSPCSCGCLKALERGRG